MLDADAGTGKHTPRENRRKREWKKNARVQLKWENSFYGGCNEPLYVCIWGKKNKQTHVYRTVEPNSLFVVGVVATQIVFLSDSVVLYVMWKHWIFFVIWMLWMVISVHLYTQSANFIVNYPLTPGYKWDSHTEFYWGKYLYFFFFFHSALSFTHCFFARFLVVVVCKTIDFVIRLVCNKSCIFSYARILKAGWRAAIASTRFSMNHNIP